MAKRQEMYTHAHRPYRITSMPRRTPWHNMVGRIPCTRFSTQHSALSYTSEQRSYHLTRWHFPLLRGRSTCSLHSYKVEIAWTQATLNKRTHNTWHHTWHRAIFYLIRPLSRGTRNWAPRMGSSYTGVALSYDDEPHSYYSKDLYI